MSLFESEKAASKASEPRYRSLQSQVLLECQAMARYAFTSGIRVPGALFEKLEQIAMQIPVKDTEELDLAAQTYVDAPRFEGISKQLAGIHGRLSELVAPAKPRTILLLSVEQKKASLFSFLGEVPLIRRLLGVSVLSLVALVAVSMSTLVDGRPDSFSLLHNNGLSLLLNLVLILTAASIGASFANLIQAQSYIKNGTFDPRYESSYWIRYVLGLMAGAILALLLPIESWMGVADDPQADPLKGLGKPLLAILGGYSSAAVYRILNVMVSAVESMVRGDAKAAVEGQEIAAQARAAKREVQSRFELASQLTALQQKLGETTDPAAIRAELDRLQRKIVDPDVYADDEEGASA